MNEEQLHAAFLALCKECGIGLSGLHEDFAKELARRAIAAERERCAAWCDNRAAYYDGEDDDGPESRRGDGARACAAVIRWPANAKLT